MSAFGRSGRTLVARSLVAAAVAAGLTLGALPGAVTPAHALDYTDVQKGFAPPSTVLSEGTPESVGLHSEPIDAAKAQVESYMQAATPDGHPLYPGAVGVMGHDGKIVAREVGGYASLYANATDKLPESQRVPMRQDTIFDLASVSKLFTSLTAVQLIEENKLDLDAPVAQYLPEFAANGKQGVTIRHLLTHTSGFTSWLPLWSKYPDKDARIKAVMDAPLANPAGSTYLYSDLNLITLGVIVEKLRGAPLDQVVSERITQPLGMVDTGYNPTARQRTAATEFQVTPNRGMVWGEVHDENAWSLGGVAGHAGVFSTADDLAKLSQALLNGGTYQGKRIMGKDSVELLIKNFNEKFPGDDHGLGFELNQRWYSAGLAGDREAGHTGYTGTSIVLDFDSRSFAILLTNRVHPSRDWGSVNPPRRDWAQGLAKAMPVNPTRGPDAWATGDKDKTTATLDLPVEPKAGARLNFDLFVDTEATDPFVLEVSQDEGKTFTPLPFTLRDADKTAAADGKLAVSGLRRWVKADATLTPGKQIVRFRNTTDNTELGRGIYVDRVRVDGSGLHFDGEKTPEAFTATNWAKVGY